MIGTGLPLSSDARCASVPLSALASVTIAPSCMRLVSSSTSGSRPASSGNLKGTNNLGCMDDAVSRAFVGVDPA